MQRFGALNVLDSINSCNPNFLQLITHQILPKKSVLKFTEFSFSTCQNMSLFCLVISINRVLLSNSLTTEEDAKNRIFEIMQDSDPEEISKTHKGVHKQAGKRRKETQLKEDKS